ncbi:MAG: nucleotidyltransferase family protein, partial [Cyanobacteria bacterium J06659_2]
MVAELESLGRDRLKASPGQIANFCQRWHIAEFALFGSVLRDDFRPDSDIDVLVTFSPSAHPSLIDLVNVQDELAKLFQRNVDVVLKTSILAGENYLRCQSILASSQVIYSAQSQLTLEKPNPQLELSRHFTDMERDQSLLPGIVLAGRKIQQYASGITW